MRGMLRPARLPPPPALPIPREVWKVNDTVFAEGLGLQVHAKMETKADSFPWAAAAVSHPSHAVRAPGPQALRPGLRRARNR